MTDRQRHPAAGSAAAGRSGRTTVPLVSVIIPTFERGPVIGAALDSVLGQRFADLEVIVVDDGSTDETAELLERATTADPRVRPLHQSNAGVASARNAGIDVARGAFIAFLDSDDAWEPWHLALALAALDRYPEAGLIWTDADAIDVDGVVMPSHLRRMLSAYRYFTLDELFAKSSPLGDLGVDIPPPHRDERLYVGDVFSPMVMGNLINGSSVVIRREWIDAVGRFDERRRTGEDYEFYLRICRLGPVAFANLPDVRIRIGTSDRLSGPAMARPIARAYLEVLEATLARDADRITLSRSLIAKARAYAHRWVGETELVAGRHRVARAHLATSLRIRPLQPAVIASLALTFLPPRAVSGVIAFRRRVSGLLAAKSSSRGPDRVGRA